MSGPSTAERFRNNGIPTKKCAVETVAIEWLSILTDGDTAHPRWDEPLDAELQEVIRDRGVPDRFVVKERGKREGRPTFIVDEKAGKVTAEWSESHGDETLVLEVIDGARRLKNALIVQAQLRRTAPRSAPLQPNKADPDGPWHLWVALDTFAGTDAELWIARLQANNPKNLPDSPRILAISIAAAKRCGADMDVVYRSMRPRISPAEMEALSRWGNLVPELRPRFDSGEIPLAALPKVLDAMPDKQVEVAEMLKASGATTTAAATRATNKDKAKKAVAKGDAPKRLEKRALAELVLSASRQAPTNLRMAAFAAGLRIAAGLGGPIPDEFKPLVEAAIAPKKGAPKK